MKNVVQANILAACSDNRDAIGQVFNIAYGTRTTLNELFELIRHIVAGNSPRAAQAKPTYRDFRAGDIRHSLADISKARALLRYSPQYSVGVGLKEAGRWYVRDVT